MRGEVPAVGRVGLPSGGTAFAVRRDLALTAFHVIGDRFAGLIRHQQVALAFGGISVAADVDAGSDPRADVALLRLREAIPAGVVPVPLTIDVDRGERWYSPGFPLKNGAGTQRTVDGTIVDPRQSQPETGANVIALYCQQAAAGSPQRLPGFSGAPVLVGDPARGAVGFIRWNPVSPDQPGVAEGGTVYACPSRSVLDRWPELRASAALSAEPPVSAGEAQHLERLIAQYERNLRTTELQIAQYGPGDVPLRLVNQLAGINDELRALRGRLGADTRQGDGRVHGY
jgi:trypsin-like peptidase